ncbi:MAG TPA: hypothetical protein VK013_07880 [Myxococcaceae bacterium]|nr:hypothetical protein [Myxococcaceae bacterium]
MSNDNDGSGTQDPRGPRAGQLILARKLIEYIERCEELGLSLGGEAEFLVSEDLEPVMLALHHVLAGGKVEVTIEEEGNPDIVKELDRRVREGLEEASELNRLAGYTLSAGV